MATYGYKAITKAGKEVKGSLEADNKDLAMAELRRQELTVIDLGEQSFLTKDIDIQIGGWPKARDLSVMCRQFVSMTKAGVSILESLKMLCEQTENKRLQDALKEVRISVEKGETLADSMAEHPKVFPAIMVNMVAAGEASGSLETALDRVAVQLEKNSKTQAMLKKAMIYPIVVCIVAVIVTIVMLVKVIPSYEDINRQISRIEYRDSSENYLAVVAKIQENSGYDWNVAVRYWEMKRGLHEQDEVSVGLMKERIGQMDNIDQKDANLKEIARELYAQIEQMDSSKRALVMPQIVAVDAIRIFNQIGKFATADVLGCTYENMPDSWALAKELETWFYFYKRVYRSISEESELRYIQELVCWYGDYLRQIK